MMMLGERKCAFVMESKVCVCVRVLVNHCLRPMFTREQDRLYRSIVHGGG